MELQLGMFIVDTVSSIAFVITAYYAFKANYDSAKLNKHSTEKDKKIMQFYQQSINERNRERRIDDMVAYTQAMLSKWCRKTPAFRLLVGKKASSKYSSKKIDFKNQRLASNDIYFDGINLTFWRSLLNLSTEEDGSESKDKVFVMKVGKLIEDTRNENQKFDAVIRLLLSNLDDFTEPREEKMQLFQCFRNANTIYQSTTITNRIISSLYTNKVVRNNLFAILKHRVPPARADYDEDLQRIIGILQ